MDRTTVQATTRTIELACEQIRFFCDPEQDCSTSVADKYLPLMIALGVATHVMKKREAIIDALRSFIQSRAVEHGCDIVEADATVGYLRVSPRSRKPPERGSEVLNRISDRIIEISESGVEGDELEVCMWHIAELAFSRAASDKKFAYQLALCSREITWLLAETFGEGSVRELIEHVSRANAEACHAA